MVMICFFSSPDSQAGSLYKWTKPRNHEEKGKCYSSTIWRWNPLGRGGDIKRRRCRGQWWWRSADHRQQRGVEQRDRERNGKQRRSVDEPWKQRSTENSGTRVFHGSGRCRDDEWKLPHISSGLKMIKPKPSTHDWHKVAFMLWPYMKLVHNVEIELFLSCWRSQSLLGQQTKTLDISRFR